MDIVLIAFVGVAGMAVGIWRRQRTSQAQPGRRSLQIILMSVWVAYLATGLFYSYTAGIRRGALDAAHAPKGTDGFRHAKDQYPAWAYDGTLWAALLGALFVALSVHWWVFHRHGSVPSGRASADPAPK